MMSNMVWLRTYAAAIISDTEKIAWRAWACGGFKYTARRDPDAGVRGGGNKRHRESARSRASSVTWCAGSACQHLPSVFAAGRHSRARSGRAASDDALGQADHDGLRGLSGVLAWRGVWE